MIAGASSPPPRRALSRARDLAPLLLAAVACVSAPAERPPEPSAAAPRDPQAAPTRLLIQMPARPKIASGSAGFAISNRGSSR